MDFDRVLEKEKRHNRKKRELLDKKKEGFKKTKKAIHKKIAERAYERYEKRDSAHGHDWEDWFEAEKDMQVGD